MIALAVSASLVATRALAGPAEDAFAAARQAEVELRFADAARGYEEALREAPSAGFATTARTRLDELHAHAEGDYVPLATLEAVRRDPAKSGSREALLALLDDARSFPPGRVQRSARLLAAEAFVKRLGAPGDALAPTRAILDDPTADKLTRTSAANLLVDALVALGRRDEALAEAQRHRALVPAAWDKLRKEVWRARLLPAARGILLGALVVVTVVVTRARRLDLRTALPRAVLASAAIALGGASLAHLYDESLSVLPFFLLGLGAFVAERAARIVRSAGAPKALALTIGLLSLFAASYLALAMNDGEYLGGFGL